MITLAPEHLRAILRSKVLRPHVLEAIQKCPDGPARYGGNPKLLPDEALINIYDACMDVWSSCSPVVRQSSRQGGYGRFPVQVLGVRGAYYIFAPEFDMEGPFTTVQEAAEAWDYHFG